ncbi:MAG: hypothetical protein ACE5ID_11520 [Acidobacteriota bacterium]
MKGVILRGIVARTLLLLAVALYLQASAGATEKSRRKDLPSPVSGKAVACFIRPPQTALYYRTLFIHADEQFLGVLVRNSFTCAELSPGSHLLWNAHADPDRLLGPAAREVDLEAGTISYFRMNYVEGSRPIQVEFIPVDEAQGRNLILKVKVQTRPDEKDRARAAAQIRLKFGFASGKLGASRTEPAPSHPGGGEFQAGGTVETQGAPAAGEAGMSHMDSGTAPAGESSGDMKPARVPSEKGDAGAGTRPSEATRRPAATRSAKAGGRAKEETRRPSGRDFCAGKILVLEVNTDSEPEPPGSTQAKTAVDDVKFRKSLVKRLEKEGYRVIPAGNPADGVLNVTLRQEGAWKAGRHPSFEAAVHLKGVDGRILWEDRFTAGRDAYPSSFNVWSSLARKTARRLRAVCRGRARF